jgi:hypothetical protein
VAEHRDNIFTRPLGELTAAELHIRGIARLEQSMARQDPADQAALASQAMALFFASLSADNLEAPAAGAHRPGAVPEAAGNHAG